METTRNNTATDLAPQVQALICIKAFDNLCAKCRAAGGLRLVPLKGIDLLRTLYSDTLDRELKDIDLLVLPPRRVADLVAILQADGYRPQFPFSLTPRALASKQKVSMLSPSPMLPNVDIHMALITKRLLAPSTNPFNRDALQRASSADSVVSELDSTDRWLLLATHLALHHLEGPKWYRDLALLSDRLNPLQAAQLQARARQYNLRRIVAAVSATMLSRHPACHPPLAPSSLLTSRADRRFARYIARLKATPSKPPKGINLDRYYWQLPLIDRTNHRLKAGLRLLLPTTGDMQNTYRCRTLPALLLYPPHLILNTLGLLLFAARYLILSTTPAPIHNA